MKITLQQMAEIAPNEKWLSLFKPLDKDRFFIPRIGESIEDVLYHDAHKVVDVVYNITSDETLCTVYIEELQRETIDYYHSTSNLIKSAEIYGWKVIDHDI